MKVTYDYSVESVRFEFRSEFYDADRRKQVFKEDGLAAMLKFRQNILFGGFMYMEDTAPEPERNPFPNSFQVTGNVKNLKQFRWNPEPKSIQTFVETLMRGAKIDKLYVCRENYDVHHAVNVPKED
jgi:hypothetical protein